MADNCNDRVAPTIEVPPDESSGEHTKEELLEMLGYEEIPISKTDSDGKTVTVTVAGSITETGG